MPDPGFLRDAADLARRAVECERDKNYPVAIHFYNESAYLLERALASDENPDESSASNTDIGKRIVQYKQRALYLENVCREKTKEEDAKEKKKSPEELQFEKAYFLTTQALEQDEGGNGSEAVDLYSQAVAVCIEAISIPNIDPEISQKLNSLAKQALERAESLKGISSKLAAVVTLDDPPPPPVTTAFAAPAAAAENTSSASGSGYTDEEKLVLLRTSRINGIEYVPFLSVDLKERFNYSLMFEDKNGLLKLSPKQRQGMKRWARPQELFPNPKMIERIDPFSIKQTLVSDCSFVASLAISANYEKRFGKKLIRNIIYPQNPRTGEPIVNPFGKYMIILLINGVRRKVIIDDLLPTGPNGELLCSYSARKGELWVSLLEKAYMKVMGGYDFPGSNSNIDLHALTGWIPERLSIAAIEDRDKVFKMLMTKLHEGQVLLTVATGEMEDRIADQAGLVPTHAYAVLDIQEVRGVKLLLLKNPWSHLRWRGNYSELDAVHWTDEMKRAMNYDPKNAELFDNGVFWIDYASICKFFDVFYMSWNPEIFYYKYVVHRSWLVASGPVKDLYTIGENPQYSLEVNCGGKSVAVWVLLTRHITDIIDFKENREYITLVVYDNDGKRVYYPHEKVLLDGVRINSPHYLCKIVTPAESIKRYTLVVSQYEKTTTTHYTLRVYSSAPFKMGEIVNSFKHKRKLTGEWRGLSAGGCANHPETYIHNPCYRIELKQEGKLLIDLKGPKDYQVGFDIMCANSASGGGAFFKKSSGPYRPGFVIMELPNTPAGLYNVIPSTYLPKCVGNFFLTIQSTSPFEVTKVVL